MAGSVRTLELRVLEGPNLYFPRPAIKLTLAVPGWLRAPEPAVARLAEQLGLGAVVRPGAPGTEQRRRAIARIAAQLARRIAVGGGARRLAVRARPGPGSDLVVVAFPWRRRTAAEALATELAQALAQVRRRSPARVIAEAGRPAGRGRSGSGAFGARARRSR